jgi:hypothetical protein
MIPAPAEAGKNTKNVAVQIFKKIKRSVNE